MVALASLALQSTNKLFQKGNLENKRLILTLSGADVRAQSLVLIPEHLGDVTDFLAGYFLRKWNLTTVSSAQMREIMATPMFISASQNTTLVMPVWRWHYLYISSNGELQLLTVTNERDFPPSVTWTEGESETTLLERLFMIYWFY